MLKVDGNLSPDLEWMLQSNQVDIDSLIEILVTSYYQQIYLLALSRLTYPEESHRVAQETLIQTILQKKDFRGETSVTEWIEAIAIGVIEERKSNLETLHFLNPNLINSIHARQPGNNLSTRQLQNAIEAIKFQLQAQKYSKSKWARLQLLGLTGIILLVVYLLFNFSSAMFATTPADYAPASSQTSGSNATENIISSPTPVDPSPTGNDRNRSIISTNLHPLTINSSSEELKERIQSSSQLWNTMWADIVVRFYGSEGYVGPPFTERHQLWIDQDEGAFQIIGPTQGIPDSIERIIFSPENSPTRLGLIETTGYSKLGSQYPWFSIKSETVFLFPFAINFLFKTFDQDNLRNAEFSVIGEEVIADREAVIVELTSPEDKIHARLWLDTQFGIILREQYYDQYENDKVIIESSLRKIHFDDSIPTMRKRPEKTTPAPIDVLPEITGLSDQSSSAAPGYPMMGFPFRSPPTSFDLSQSRILFAKADRTDLDRTETGKFHIFADNYFLGDIEMIDPLKVICDRSPDGTKIVFSDWRIFPTEVNEKIYWLDLQNLDLVQLRIPDTTVFWTSFSPDNQKVVVSGYDMPDEQERFFLIDTNTGDFDLLPIRAGYSGVAWSPDGAQIAIMEWSILPSIRGSKTKIRIYDSQNGKKIDNVITDGILRESNRVEIPLEDWTANFQIPLQDLSQCTAAQ
jgi:hypothetical protein